MASVPVLARLMSRRRRALADHLPASLEADVTGVHQARVASRRLRELVPIIGGALSPRKQRRLPKRLRTLTRALGRVRELDVALASIDQLAATHVEPRVALAVLREQLACEREARGAWLEQHFDRGRAHRLLVRLERVESVLTTTASPAGWRTVLAERIRSRAHGLQTAVADAGALFDGERLHQVRIAVKKLRYALEVAGQARAATTGALVRQLKEMQDVLGRLHDVEVLLGYARTLSTDAPAKPGLAAAVDWLDRELTAETRRLHARYLRRQTALVAVADRALDVVAPRVEAGASREATTPQVDHA
jgi:CHAD domain-containing protein